MGPRWLCLCVAVLMSACAGTALATDAVSGAAREFANAAATADHQLQLQQHLELDAALLARIRHDPLSTLLGELTDLRDIDHSCASGEEETRVMKKLARSKSKHVSLPSCQDMRNHVKTQLALAVAKLKLRCKKLAARCNKRTRESVKLLRRELPKLKHAVIAHMRYSLIKSLYTRAHQQIANRPATIERLSLMLQQCRDEMAALHRTDQDYQQRMSAMLMSMAGLSMPTSTTFDGSALSG